jgi:hypothetical protein
VDIAGENSAAWANATISAGLLLSLTAKATLLWTGFGVVGCWEVDEPQVGVNVTSTGKDGAGSVVDCYRGVGEGCRAPSIAELADGEQGGNAKCWEKVGNAGFWWKLWDAEVGNVA